MVCSLNVFEVKRCWCGKGKILNNSNACPTFCLFHTTTYFPFDSRLICSSLHEYVNWHKHNTSVNFYEASLACHEKIIFHKLYSFSKFHTLSMPSIGVNPQIRTYSVYSNITFDIERLGSISTNALKKSGDTSIDDEIVEGNTKKKKMRQ